MSYTQTPHLGLFKPAPNSDTGLWGYHLNNNADALDNALGNNLSGLGGPFLPLTGGTVGALSVGSNTGAQPLTMNGPAGSSRALHIQTAGLDRWVISGGPAAESGSNAGTLLSIARYDDTGALLDTPLSINRASGVVSFAQGGNGIAIGTPTIRSGTGAATGTQPSGSLWLRSDGTAGARIYVSQGGGTWVPIATV